MELISVAALSENRVIGKDSDLPSWYLPKDLKQYKERTTGVPIIVGRKTAKKEMLERSSHPIILSRSENVEGAAYTANSVEGAVKHAKSQGFEKVYVLGGGEIYKQFLPLVDKMVLSHVEGTYEGDTYYPEFDEDNWNVTSRKEYDGWELVEYVRK